MDDEIPKVEVKLGGTVDETIAKLKQNGYQYATAGDARRLVIEIEKLRGLLGWIEKQVEGQIGLEATPDEFVAAMVAEVSS